MTSLPLTVRQEFSSYTINGIATDSRIRRGRGEVAVGTAISYRRRNFAATSTINRSRVTPVTHVMTGALSRPAAKAVSKRCRRKLWVSTVNKCAPPLA